MYERKMKKVEVDMSKYEVTPETTQAAVKTLVDNNININPASHLSLKSKQTLVADYFPHLLSNSNHIYKSKV